MQKPEETTINQYVILSKDEMNEICDRAAKIGAKTAIEKYQKERNLMHNKMIDHRLHNTKLLLRNYHMLKKNADNSVFGRSQMEESAADILYNMMSLYDDEVIVDSIRRSATRTAIIIAHIDTMISLYGTYSKESNNELDLRRYEVLYDRYITDEPLGVKSIAEKQCMSVDNVYSDLRLATESISALIFGVDGLKIS